MDERVGSRSNTTSKYLVGDELLADLVGALGGAVLARGRAVELERQVVHVPNDGSVGRVGGGCTSMFS